MVATYDDRRGWAGKRFGMMPLFDPEQGETVLDPPGSGAGYWTGAPGVTFDRGRNRFYLYYRIRVPRPGRGVECRIAESRDGLHFTDIWRARKEEFPTSSMERGALLRCLDGTYRLYLSYVDHETSKWRTDVIEADAPDGFRIGARSKVFVPDDIGVEGVKDPYVIIVGGMYYMILSYAPAPQTVNEDQRRKMHQTGDVYNTGITKSHSGLAISRDGLHFEWQGDILSPSASGWDSYAARICSVVYTPPVFTAFYDGSADVSENYEERTGLAVGWDLRDFTSISKAGPELVSPHARGALRYTDVVQFEDLLYCYYEYARPDGSHELRLNRVRRRLER